MTFFESSIELFILSNGMVVRSPKCQVLLFGLHQHFTHAKYSSGTQMLSDSKISEIVNDRNSSRITINDNKSSQHQDGKLLLLPKPEESTVYLPYSKLTEHHHVARSLSFPLLYHHLSTSHLSNTH